MKKIAVMLVALTIGFTNFPAAESLVEKLGYPADSRLLIVNSDDVGMCHAANMAAVEGQEKGMISSGTIMVPCPWFSEIADYANQNPELRFGVHLTHTSEWEGYRWGPVAPDSQVPGLIDPDGFLWKGVQSVYQHASSTEAYIEAKAQIEQFINAGIEPTHIDSHMGTLMLDPDYFQVYAQLALEYDLPLRMASQETMAAAGFPGLRKELAARGLVFPDYFVYGELGEEYGNRVEETWLEILSDLKPGVTEIYIHASTPGAELRAITNSWETRVAEYETFAGSAKLKRLLEENDIKLISYSPLKKLQRNRKNGSEDGKK